MTIMKLHQDRSPIDLRAKDPVANQVRGDLTIVPAPVPTGITSYAVYLGNGTKKDFNRGRLCDIGELQWNI
jgi:hypothetical protein